MQVQRLSVVRPGHRGLGFEAGFGLIGTLVTIIGVLVLLVAAPIGFYEGRKAYWDAQVRAMCAKDGGVQIVEKVVVSSTEIQSLGKVGNLIGIPDVQLAKHDAPVYMDPKTTELRTWDPIVVRSELLIVRRKNTAVVARAIMYARSGGDFPFPAHPSSYSCPSFDLILEDLQKLFIVEGEQK